VAEKVIAKTVAHIHSVWSYDGKWELSKIASFFGRLGYDVILTAEHNRTFDKQRWENYKKSCREASTKRTLIIPGIEYSDETNTIHVLVWGVSVLLGNNQPTGDLLRKATEKNGICVLAHPSRRKAWQQLDAAWLPLLHGLELWNRKADGIAPSREAIDLLKANSKLKPFVGLDFHRPNQLFPLSMMITINGSLSPDSVFDSLRSGNYQSFALGFPAIFFKSKPLFSCMILLELFRGTLVKQLRHWKKKLKYGSTP